MKFSKAAIVVGATLLCGIVLSACGSGGPDARRAPAGRAPGGRGR